MNAAVDMLEDRRRWIMAAGVALTAHVALGAMALAGMGTNEPVLPEPVMIVELPPEAAPAPAPAATQPQEQVQLQPDYVPPRVVTPPIEIPPVRAPLPRDPVALPPPPLPVKIAAPAPAPAPAPAAIPAVSNPVTVAKTGTGTGSSAVAGNDPKARKQEADYFALISAHLNRRKTYPVDARQARQQGVVTVRFTVDRHGNVSGTTIKRSSGHALLDQETLELLQRVAPLPRMPASLQRDSVTLSLPIDYSLRTS